MSNPNDNTTSLALSRRRLIEGGAAVAASAAFGLPAFAQDANYPSREVHVIAAFPAGSGADVYTRYFAENMRPFLGPNTVFIVENKVGASGKNVSYFPATSRRLP